MSRKAQLVVALAAGLLAIAVFAGDTEPVDVTLKD